MPRIRFRRSFTIEHGDFYSFRPPVYTYTKENASKTLYKVEILETNLSLTRRLHKRTITETLFIYLASPNKKTTHIHKIIRQRDLYFYGSLPIRKQSKTGVFVNREVKTLNKTQKNSIFYPFQWYTSRKP